MVKIYCYAMWNSDDVELTIGFMSSENHDIDETVFDTFHAKSFKEGMSDITTLFKREHINMDLLDQDNNHWTYSLNGDLKLQFRKIRTIIRNY